MEKNPQSNIEDKIIETRGLTRDYGSLRAVEDLSLSIERGELFGLVGPDGAGKTTTLRMLAGLLEISHGSAKVQGFDLTVEPEAVKARIGYMAQEFSLYRKLSVQENLLFFSQLYDVPPRQRSERMQRLLDFAGLIEFKDRRAMHLSGGMQKKLALACTLIHQPPILLLDEPTTGVDPVSRREFWDIVTDLHLQGTTILLSTPYMDEADRCSRVGLMYQGRMIRCDQPARIRDTLKAELLKIIPQNWQAAREYAPQLPGVIEVQTYGEALHLLVDSSQKRRKAIRKALRQAGIEIRDVRSAPVRMEEAFVSLIRDLESEDP